MYIKEYVELIKDSIRDFTYNNGYLENTKLLWDALKCHIRGTTISFSTALAKKQRQKDNELSEKLCTIEQNLNDTNYNEYQNFNQEL